jgi:serine protease Do
MKVKRICISILTALLVAFICIIPVNASSTRLYCSSCNINIPQLVNEVGPSVVGIIGKLKKSSPNYSTYGDNLTFGSGVIYKSNGYIITNAHVVSDMETIVVVLSNGKAYIARLKAIDEVSDIALIKIDKGMLKPAKFASAGDIVTGETVVAIGTPLSFSLRNSVTKGIISGINRSMDGEYRLIQSDAAINGGNSGGPLVNMDGKVIGINTVKYIGFGVEGLSFSIPIDTVKYVISHFEKFGRVRRPFLGADFIEGVAARYGLPSSEGLTITEIMEGSPAEKAGLMVDDVVMAVNNVSITTKIDYNEEIKKYLPGDTVEFIVIRNNNEIKIQVTFDEKK